MASSTNGVASHTYDVFGAIRARSGSSANPWLFTGEQSLPTDSVACRLALAGAMSTLWPAGPCAFCGRSPAPEFALTALKGDPESSASWRREVLPLCGRCHRALAEAGAEGRKVKATGERWWLGHGVGRFESRGAPRPTSARRLLSQRS
jgi:hypothetical protein